MTVSDDVTPNLRYSHWGDVADHWKHYGSPLRPCAADVRVMEEFVLHRSAGRRTQSLKVLLLGVTPEIATMAWPAGTELLAVDKSQSMIARVWPGDVPGHRKAVCADWFEFAAGPDHYDVVIGDGNFALLDYPRQYRALADRVRDLLATDGIFVTRFFILPANRESPQDVVDDLGANRIGSFHCFKFRLAMALQECASGGVRMGDVFSAWEGARIRPEALKEMTGWPLGAIETIRHFDGKDSRLSFPSAVQLDAVMSEHFDKVDERCLPYEMGDRCPIVGYRPKRTGTPLRR